jgi:tRNA threonylcarbamoyladenosine biosynthesis protein TsaB
MLLAFDTSTNYASIALVKEQKLLAELSWDCGRGHSQELFQNIRWLLASRHTSVGELGALAVATGPGSFNGVRVALAAAKSLSFALQLPLYASSTLDVIGWGAVPVSASIPSGDGDGVSRVWALLEGGRGQLYAAQYPGVASLDGIWGPLDGYHVLAASELAERIMSELGPERPVLFAGEARPETQAVLMELLPGRKRILFAGSLPSRRASWLAELALAQASRGEAADAMTLEPLYLRRPAITRSSKFALPPKAVEEANAPEATSAREETGEETSHALRR